MNITDMLICNPQVSQDLLMVALHSKTVAEIISIILILIIRLSENYQRVDHKLTFLGILEV